MIVIVSHADIIRLLLAHYLGIHRSFSAPGHFAGVGQHAGPQRRRPVRVLRINDDGPLHSPTAPAPARRSKGKDKKDRKTCRPQPPTGPNGREQHPMASTIPATGTANPTPYDLTRPHGWMKK